MNRLLKFFPKTDNLAVEGSRLALFNLAMLVVGVLFSYGVLWIIGKIRTLGIPIPLPVWLVMLFVGIPYFIIWFEYGRAFGMKLKEPNFLKGLLVGIIGQIPGFLLYYVITKANFTEIDTEIIRIISTIFRTFIITVPIMAALGSLDTKKDR